MNKPNSVPRDFHLDTLKALLIYCVVFAHVLSPYILIDRGYQFAYVIISLFAMPLFIILAGMLSKTVFSTKNVVKSIHGVLVPFIVFEVLYEIAHFLIFGEISVYFLRGSPHWIMWFLWSLMIWRLVLPFIHKLRFPVTSSLIVACAAGAIDMVEFGFGLSRTFYFLPFFVLGSTLDVPAIKVWLSRISVFVAIPTLIGFLGGTAFVLRKMPHSILYGTNPYQDFDLSFPEGVAVKLTIYCAAIIVSLLIVKIVISVPLPQTAVGPNSLYVYLWHGVIIKLIVASGLSALISGLGREPAVIVFAGLAMVITWVLSRGAVKTFTDRFMFDPASKLIRATVFRDRLPQ